MIKEVGKQLQKLIKQKGEWYTFPFLGNAYLELLQ